MGLNAPRRCSKRSSSCAGFRASALRSTGVLCAVVVACIVGYACSSDGDQKVLADDTNATVVQASVGDSSLQTDGGQGSAVAGAGSTEVAAQGADLAPSLSTDAQMHSSPVQATVVEPETTTEAAGARNPSTGVPVGVAVTIATAAAPLTSSRLPLISGTLLIDDSLGCLYLEVSNGARYHVVFPFGSTFDQTTGRVLDEEGATFAIVGEHSSFGVASERAVGLGPETCDSERSVEIWKN